MRPRPRETTVGPNRDEVSVTTAATASAKPIRLQIRTISVGSRVLIEDLDDGSSEEYVLVSQAESNLAAGRLSCESPVGRAIEGHRPGDTVDAHAPRRIRHLRIAAVDDDRQGA